MKTPVNVGNQVAMIFIPRVYVSSSVCLAHVLYNLFASCDILQHPASSGKLAVPVDWEINAATDILIHITQVTTVIIF